jgi:hypothetical protein
VVVVGLGGCGIRIGLRERGEGGDRQVRLVHRSVGFVVAIGSGREIRPLPKPHYGNENEERRSKKRDSRSLSLFGVIVFRSIEPRKSLLR